MFQDRYELRDRLGAGGMAKVYRGHDRVLGRTVAIKMLHEELAENDEVGARFLREARIFARLRHPHVVEIYDVVLDQIGERKAAAMVMELVEGADLSRVLAGRPRLVPELAVMLVRPVADALAYAHAEGIVHRDVKPANMLLGRDGRVKLSDFGIAKITEETNLTRTGDFLGTPAYIAPEQAKGEPTGPAADQYALGAVLYELVCGRPPFTGPTALAILTRILAGDYPDPRTLNPMVDDALAAIIARALSVEPADRFADVATFLAELEAYAPPLPRSRERSIVAGLVESPGATAEAVAHEAAAAQVTTARRLLAQGEAEAARRAAEAALARRPDDPDARAVLEALDRALALVPSESAIATSLRVSAPPPIAPTPAPAPAARRGPLAIGLVALALVAAAAVVLLAGPPPPEAIPVVAVAAPTGPPAWTRPPAEPAPPPVSEAAPPPVSEAAPVARVAAAPEADASVRPRRERPPPVAVTPAPAPPSAPPPDPPAPAPAQPGRVAIHTFPWAEVFVDGEKRGETPGLKELVLPPGTYLLELRNPGFPAHRETVTLASGQALTRRVRLSATQ